MADAETLDPQPGECVLDLAAAPGGKTTHIASLMKGEGVIVANEVHSRRVWELAQNLERWGAHNVIITNESPQRLTGSFSDTFDRVLLDAPCSGEGMFRRSETARGEWSPSLVTSCARRQSAILDEAASMVRPGGILLYTTCTFAPEENEGVIAHFPAQHSDFHLVEIPVTHGFSARRPGWGVQNGAFPELRYTARLWPHRLSGEGHFIAKLQRKDCENTGQTSRRPFRLSKIPVHVKQYCQDFWLKNMATELDAGHLHLQGSYFKSLIAIHG